MRFAPLLALALAACAHTDKPAAQQLEKAEKTEQPQAKAPRKPPKSESGIQLATSPTDALTHQGLISVEKALEVRGYLHGQRPSFDEQVKDAMARFQKKEGLPATGAPDRETVRRLGLHTEEVFKDERLGKQPPAN
jgi:murein L,D-transpeptidase YcbB/YkuD